VPNILLIQGPNLSYLGRRQPEIYGRTSAAELDAMLLEHARANKYRLEIFYTHSEAAAIERLYRAVDEKIDGLVMNPAAFTLNGESSSLLPIWSILTRLEAVISSKKSP